MRIAYRNVAEVLDHFGCTMADVVTQTVFFVGEADAAVAAGGAVRAEVFGTELPASAMVGARLPREVIAIRTEEDERAGASPWVMLV